MRPNLINRLKEEWNNLDPVDPLRGLIADAIDALTQPEQPSKPLTDEEIKRLKPISADFVSFRAGVRCMEREYRIGEKR